MDYVLPLHDLRDASSARLCYFLTVPPGVTIAEVTTKKFWSHAYKLLERKKHTLLEVIAEDGSWEAMIRVLAVEPDGTVKFRVVHHAKSEVKGTVPKGYRVEFVREHGWRTFDPSGLQVGGYEPTEADAVSLAIANTRRAAAAAA